MAKKQGNKKRVVYVKRGSGEILLLVHSPEVLGTPSNSHPGVPPPSLP